MCVLFSLSNWINRVLKGHRNVDVMQLNHHKRAANPLTCFNEIFKMCFDLNNKLACLFGSPRSDLGPS